MEHNQLPLENEAVLPDFEKAPREYENVPHEFEKAPAEHVIPLEYPKYIPTKKPKKRGLNAMLAYAFAGVFVLYMAFGFLFPSQPSYGDNNGGGNNGGYWDPDDSGKPGDLPKPQDTEIFLHYQEDLGNAATRLQNDDYVGAATAIAQTLQENCSAYDPAKMDGTVMVYVNGAFAQFDGQKLPKGQGVYLWIQEEVIFYEDVKDGTFYPEQMLVFYLVRVNESAADTKELSILQMNISANNLLYGYIYCDVSHLHTTADDALNGENAVLTVFSMSQNDYDAADATVRDNYVIYGTRRVEGKLQNGTFTGAVKLQTSGMELNGDKTQLQINAEQADQGWIYMLGSNGVIDPKSDRYADLTSYTHGEQDFTDKVEAVNEDPEYYGYYYLQGGESPTLYLKNLSNDEYAWEHYVYNWNSQAFPLRDLFYYWEVMKAHM